MANIKLVKELVYTFVGGRDATNSYVYDIDGVMANGDSADMQRAVHATSFEVTAPEPELKELVADGGVARTYRANPTTSVTGNAGFLVLDTNISANINNTILYTEGQHETQIIAQDCYTFNNMCMVQNYRCDVYASGSWTSKWYVKEFWDMTAFLLQPSAIVSPADDPPTYNYALTFQKTTKPLHGEAVTAANYGFAKGIGREYVSDNPVIYGVLIGNGAATTHVIGSDYVPAGESATYLQVWKDGVELTYTTDFSISGQTITWVVAPAAATVNVFKLEFSGDAC